MKSYSKLLGVVLMLVFGLGVVGLVGRAARRWKRLL